MNSRSNAEIGPCSPSRALAQTSSRFEVRPLSGSMSASTPSMTSTAFPGGCAAKAALSVFAVVMHRRHQRAGFVADRSQGIADLCRFGIVILVFHAESRRDRINHDVTETN